MDNILKLIQDCEALSFLNNKAHMDQDAKKKIIEEWKRGDNVLIKARKEFQQLQQKVKELEARCKNLILTYIVDDQAWDRDKEVQEIWESMEKAVQNDS